MLKGLHPAQRRAVVVSEDTQLVLAGAGAGKTQTMAAKVADTLRLGRTTPEHVAVVTFTNKAAKEIRERIGTLAGQPTEGMFVGTIHRLAKQMLTQAPGAGGTRIHDPPRVHADAALALSGRSMVQAVEDGTWRALRQVPRWGTQATPLRRSPSVGPSAEYNSP